MRKLAVVAFGGNALLRSGQKGTYQEQIENVENTCESLCALLKRNYNVVIGHGNGPQVGNVMLQHEAGKLAGVQAMPMDFCVAETQGSIAYLIEMGLRNVMARNDIQRDVVTLVTQVAVNKLDPMFQNPTKPVGPYYTKEQADEFARETGAKYKEDPKGNGWRKVVASPMPTSSTSSPTCPRCTSTSARRTSRRWTPSPSHKPRSISKRASLPKARWLPRCAPPSCLLSTAARSASSLRPASLTTPTAAHA